MPFARIKVRDHSAGRMSVQETLHTYYRSVQKFQVLPSQAPLAQQVQLGSLPRWRQEPLWGPKLRQLGMAALLVLHLARQQLHQLRRPLGCNGNTLQSAVVQHCEIEIWHENETSLGLQLPCIERAVSDCTSPDVQIPKGEKDTFKPVRLTYFSSSPGAPQLWPPCPPFFSVSCLAKTVVCQQC